MEIARKSSSLIYDSSRPRLAILDEARELYRYRDLLWSLIHRDLTIRYKRSTWFSVDDVESPVDDAGADHRLFTSFPFFK
jgi:hypothetical protein